MLKAWIQVSVHGTNVLFKASSVTNSSVWIKRLKSSRVQPAINSDHSEFKFPNILTDKSYTEAEERKVPQIDRNSEPIIKCKRPEFNHYRNQKYEDFNKIPLATKGWKRTASKGDHFSILIHTKDFKPESRKEPASFNDTKLDRALIDILDTHGIKTPSEIQSKAIPPILAGKNCLLAAETGCGKTIAYLVPIIQQILQFKRSAAYEKDFNAPLGLIITPGRDLAEQIYGVASWFSSELDLDCQVLIGGRGKKKLLNANFEDVDLLICSLGLLSKFTTNGIYTMRNIRHVVLDEADTLLDDSFNELLIHFLKRIQFTSNRWKKDMGAQMILASATMPTSLADLLSDTVDLENLERITTSGLHFIMPHVKQNFYRVGKSQKAGYLLQFAKEAVKNKLPTIIFCNTATTSDWVSIFLGDNNIKCINLNGDMPAEMRVGRFKSFQNGDVNFISTTDLCARGLDTKRAKRIINYDFPRFISDYIHRVGRIGRLGSPRNCDVINLVSNHHFEVKLVQDLELAVRTISSFHNVNPNIRRLLQKRFEKKANIIYEISDQPPEFE